MFSIKLIRYIFQIILGQRNLESTSDISSRFTFDGKHWIIIPKDRTQEYSYFFIGTNLHILY